MPSSVKLPWGTGHKHKDWKDKGLTSALSQDGATWGKVPWPLGRSSAPSQRLPLMVLLQGADFIWNRATAMG